MIKEGMKIEMIENCIDNPSIKEGWTGTVDFIDSMGNLGVEFDHFVTGNGVTDFGNKNITNYWYVKPNQVMAV